MTAVARLASTRRGRLTVVAFVFHLVLLVAPLSAADVTDYLGRLVVAVQVDGQREASGPVLQDFIVTRIGAPLSLEQVRESILHLFSLGVFEDIQVDATLQGEGVALRYAVVPVQRVERMEFQGDLRLSSGRLRAALTDRYGERPPLAAVIGASALLQELYRDSGYLEAAVDVIPRTTGSGEPAALVFDIAAGERSRVATLQIDGAPQQPPEQLFHELDLRVGMPYDRAAIERRLDRQAEALRSGGRYEAKLGHAIAIRPDGQIDVTVRVDPGPLVSVAIEGDRLPDQVRQELVPIASEGSADEDLLEDSSRRIVDYLRAQGFWKAEAPYSRTEVGDDLSVVFRVDRERLYRVAQIQISGNAVLATDVLLSRLNLRRGAPFVESTFRADVTAVADEYRHAGYAQAQVTTDVLEGTPDATGGDLSAEPPLVTLRITIVEGPRMLVGSISLEGAPDSERARLDATVTSALGAPYVRSLMLADRDAVLAHFLNQGYEAASVQVDAVFNENVVDLIFLIEPGNQILVDHVLITGQEHISAATIRRELTLRPGQPLGRDRIAESQRRLSALGLFRRIRITELSHGHENRRDVLVAVEEAPATTLGYGGGFEAGTRLRRGRSDGGRAVERVEFAPRGFFEIERRNLWGKNRSLGLFTRVSLRPQNRVSAQTDQAAAQQSGDDFGFNEYRVLGTYREPRIVGGAAEVLVSAFIEQSIRSSFNLKQRGVHAELIRSLGPTASVSGGYTFDQDELFDEQFDPDEGPLIDRLFPEIFLSTFSSLLVRDSRDDAFEPTRGALVSVDAEIAGRAIGSEVGFAKTLLQGFMYRRVGGASDVIFATGIRVGLATGFRREVVQTDEDGNEVLEPDGQPIVTTVRDLPASERFFAGGNTTVRGFALDRLGNADTIDQNGFPQGGNGMIILNTELRVPIRGSIGAVAFLDAGNVFRTVSDIGLGRLRGAAGFGIRYRSPIGPIRVDLGFKLDRLEVDEGLTALHVSIGQAF